MFFTTYLQLIFGLNVPFLRSLFVFCSSSLYLPVRLAPSFVRLLFVLCSSFVRLLFVFRSSFVRLLFVFCSSFVRHSFVFSLSVRAARTICLCGSHCATTACATRTFNASFFTKLLSHTYQNTSQRFFSRQS